VQIINSQKYIVSCFSDSQLVLCVASVKCFPLSSRHVVENRFSTGNDEALPISSWRFLLTWKQCSLAEHQWVVVVISWDIPYYNHTILISPRIYDVCFTSFIFVNWNGDRLLTLAAATSRRLWSTVAGIALCVSHNVCLLTLTFWLALLLVCILADSLPLIALYRRYKFHFLVAKRQDS